MPRWVVPEWETRGLGHGFLGREFDCQGNVSAVLPGKELLLLKQEHGKKIIRISEPLAEEQIAAWKSAPPEADAWVIDTSKIGRENLAFGIKTADCIPVLFCSTTSPIIGAAHCGWRGAQAGLLVDVLVLMKRLGASPKSIEVALGPGAQVGAYEVGGEVKKAFDGAFEFVNFPTATNVPHPIEQRDGKLFANIYNLLYAQSIFCGVPRDKVPRSTLCTITDERFFSYRREVEKAGRQLSYISC